MFDELDDTWILSQITSQSIQWKTIMQTHRSLRRMKVGRIIIAKRFLFESEFRTQNNQYSFFSHFASCPRICGDEMSSFNSLKCFLFENDRKNFYFLWNKEDSDVKLGTTTVLTFKCTVVMPHRNSILVMKKLYYLTEYKESRRWNIEEHI